MESINELLVKMLKAKDAGRSRTLQTQVGPSELGGCSRKVWYRLNGQPETNEHTLKLAAIMGTAIHTEIEHAFRLQDPDGEKYWLETAVEFGGIKSHIDLYVPELRTVVDWKTVKAKTLSYFPSQQQRWQVQVYGYLLTHGKQQLVENVALVAIPRDGDERDIKVHMEPYDEKIALEALTWLALLKEKKEAPLPEKDAVSYCAHYCQYYDQSGELGCAGLSKGSTVDGTMIDSSAEITAIKYYDLDQQIKSLEKEKDSLKTFLEGFTGVTSTGLKVAWTAVAARATVDTTEVEKLLGFLPQKFGKESMRLEIKPMSGGK